MTAALKLVKDETTEPKAARKKPTIAEQIRDLQNRQRGLAKQSINELLTMMEAAAKLAAEIADSGDAYPAGIRDLAERYAERSRADALNVTALAARIS